MDHNDVVAQFCQRLSADFDRRYWIDAVERRSFPTEVWKAIGAAGHLGTLVPTDRGGAGLGIAEMAVVTRELARCGFPLLTLITGPGLALPAVASHGSETLRTEMLAKLISGESVIGFAITEADAGSNIGGVATTAQVDGDTILVDGRKDYTSVADVAKHLIVVARTPRAESDSDRPDGFTLVVVPIDAPGVTVEEADTRIAAAERQSVVTFESVAVDLDMVVGEPGEGLRVLRPAQVRERVLAGALSCGLGEFALERATERVATRHVHASALGAHQGVQHPLAAAASHLRAAWLLVESACAEADDGGTALGTANMALYVAGQAGHQATDAALQACGGFGYTRRSEVFAAHQLARLLRSAPVPAESALNAVGELVLGLPRSY